MCYVFVPEIENTVSIGTFESLTGLFQRTKLLKFVQFEPKRLLFAWSEEFVQKNRAHINRAFTVFTGRLGKLRSLKLDSDLQILTER